jgi:hypothetical protein
MIKAITGHKTLTEVSRYTRAVDQARLARLAVERLQTDAEHKLSNLDTGLDKIARKVLK